MVCLVVSILLTRTGLAQTTDSTPEPPPPVSSEVESVANPVETQENNDSGDSTATPGEAPPAETTTTAAPNETRASNVPGSESASPRTVEEDFVRALDGKSIPLSQSPVAATVLSGDDLRAMGVTSLAEAFRYIPEMDAFQLNGFTYAAGIRGVDDEFNPRFQVYLDGRLVNIAEFGGVDWESIPVSIEDIERVEIIRGAGIPGESGSALTGAVRIYTVKPADVPILTYSGYYGASPRRNLHVGRVGGSHGAFSGKATVEYRDDDGVSGTNAVGLEDGERLLKFNAQGVWQMLETMDLTLGVSGITGRLKETNGPPLSNGRVDTDNLSFVAQLHQAFESGVRLDLQYSFETFSLEVLDHPNAILKGAGDNIDLDRTTNTIFAATRVPLTAHWELTAHGGWKEDRVSFEMNTPETSNQQILHAQIGTEATLWERLFVSAGGRLEKDLWAGLDLSPFVGAAYEFLPLHTLRASYRIGRRQPNFAEVRSAFVVPNPFPPPGTLPLLTGERDLDRETVEAWEAGYRGVFPDLGLLFDGQFFFHELRDKIEFVPDPTSPVPVALTFDNEGRERGLGTELLAEWKVHGPLTLYANYAYQWWRDRDNDTLRNRPEHKFNVGSRVAFTEGWMKGLSAFVNLGWVDDLKQTDLNGVRHTVRDHFRLDFRIAKKLFDDRMEIAVIGRNILNSETLESRPAFGSNFDGTFEAERLFFVNLRMDL